MDKKLMKEAAEYSVLKNKKDKKEIWFDGVAWYLAALWHGVAATPKQNKLILIKDVRDGYTLDYNHPETQWPVMAEKMEVKEWCYIDDLLPQRVMDITPDFTDGIRNRIAHIKASFHVPEGLEGIAGYYSYTKTTYEPKEVKESKKCCDDRTETIEAAKKDLISATNIKGSPDEMKVLDNFLFRCWQMGWLDRYKPKRTVYISIPISGFDLQEVRKHAECTETNLKADGYEVINPLKNGIPVEAPREVHLKRDIEDVLKCDAIFMCLGWEESKGCLTELGVAEAIGLKVIYENEDSPCIE